MAAVEKMEAKLDLVLARGPLGQHTPLQEQGGVVKERALSALDTATPTEASVTPTLSPPSSFVPPLSLAAATTNPLPPEAKAVHGDVDHHNCSSSVSPPHLPSTCSNDMVPPSTHLSSSSPVTHTYYAPISPAPTKRAWQPFAWPRKHELQQHATAHVQQLFGSTMQPAVQPMQVLFGQASATSTSAICAVGVPAHSYRHYDFQPP